MYVFRLWEETRESGEIYEIPILTCKLHKDPRSKLWIEPGLSRCEGQSSQLSHEDLAIALPDARDYRRTTA